MGQARIFALAVGDLHGMLVRSALRAATTTDSKKITPADGLRILEQRELITADENSQLNRLVSALTGEDHESVRAQAAQLHSSLVDDPASSPVALAITSIAVNSLGLEEAFATHGAIAHADAEGAIGGAILGGEIGAAVGAPAAIASAGLSEAGSVIQGAIIGGLIGGAAASIAEAV